jgi:hypothetical protein
MKQRILVLAIAGLLTSSPAVAEDWNDEVVSSAKARAELARAEDLAVARLLEAEMLVEAERTKRSGVRLMETTKALTSLGELSEAADTKVYVAAVDLVSPSGKTHTELVPVTPEEAERMKMEAAGSSAEDLADLFDGMAGGLLVLGEGLREGISSSGWGGILAPKSGADHLGGFDGNNLNEKCATYMRYNDVAREGLKGTSREKEFQQTQQMIALGISQDGIDPSLAMVGPACMYAVMAGRLREPTETYKDVRNRAIERFNSTAKYFGRESIEGYPTERIAVDGLSLKQTTEEGQEIVIERFDVWIDPKYLKRRKVRMEGTLKEKGKTRKIFMERENRDYRRVGDSVMYEPYLEILRVGGIMDAKQKKELAKAQKELEQMERQMAAMPASQRQMMESMVGPQLDQLRNMASDGAITMEIVTTDIIINPDLSDDGAFYAMFTGKGGMPDANGGSLPGGDNSVAVIQIVQSSLAELGYQPGPATGQMTDATRSAIREYQASRGLAVTGQPSPQLAASLQAEAGAL